MEFQDYMLFEAHAGGPFELPARFFDDNGELDLEAGMTYLKEKGYIYNDDLNMPQYGEELKEAHPGAYRFLECYYDSRRRAITDKLIEDGFVDYFIEDGQEVLRWTKKGVEFIENQSGQAPEEL